MSSEAILRVATYHNRRFDGVVIRSRTAPEVCEVLETAFPTSPTSGLAILDTLPPELLVAICRKLDLLSYFRFRQVNRRARVISTGVREYRAVARHGLEGLRGMLRVGLAPMFTIQDLYGPLIQERCTLCDRFGGFLFLPTATRCCMACLQRSPETSVVAFSTLAKRAKISSPRLLRTLGPQLRPVPGQYSFFNLDFRCPKFLVAARPAIAKLVESRLLSQAKARGISELLDAGSDRLDGQRFMAATAFPWYDPVGERVEHGVNCSGCLVPPLFGPGARHEKHIENRDRVYSQSEFLTSHFPSCTVAQSLWEHTEGGTKPVQDYLWSQRLRFAQHM